MVFPSLSSSGPCSIWASTNAATGRPSGSSPASGVAASAAGSASRTGVPSRSLTREDLLHAPQPGKGFGAHHAWRETRPFLVHPGGDLDGSPCRDAGVVHGFDRFDPGEHAVRPVELAAGRLAVDMRPGHDGRQAGVAAVPPQEQVACRVDENAEAEFRGPGGQPAARLDFFRGKRLPVDAALAGRAELRKLHMTPPQTGLVDEAGDDARAFRHVSLSGRTTERTRPRTVSFRSSGPLRPSRRTRRERR